ncbi:hypothetical protein C2G38_2223565 [Gigaspora rosea]|uniref:BTB domain-containing protein n=1 Tax=Gigaspora rosea TaxID=44941 RepID=A0A397U5G2_9GLOM|nr:hypothetical protein C2G38_2223565 [Gigaspora rosea]
MFVKLFSVFSQKIKNLLTDSDKYNMIIYVGRDKNIKIFKAHSLILRAKCSYYKTTLSEQWIKQNNIYSGTIILKDRDTMEALEMLAIADELLLLDLLDFIQNHLIHNPHKNDRIL